MQNHTQAYVIINKLNWYIKKLVQDYPDNPWRYIGLGNMYFLDHEKDYVKAKEFYEKSSAIARDKSGITALKERLEDLENEIKE